MDINPDVAWATILGGALAWELRTVFNKKLGDTLSERLRVWFRTNTTGGKVVFVASWLALTAWFVPHIIFGGQ
jgi:hypothetical protein